MALLRKPLDQCVNGDGRPVHPPSWVLCEQCFTKLDQQFRDLEAKLTKRATAGGGKHE